MFSTKYFSNKRNKKLAFEALQAIKQNDYYKAKTLGEKLIKKGDPYGKTILGALFAHGAGVPYDNQKALEFFNQAYSEGEAEAGFQIGLLIRSKKINGNPIDAFNLFLEAANNGVTDAYHELSLCFYEGYGCTQDNSLAYTWMVRSEELGNEQSKAYRAFFEMSGVGVNENEDNFRSGLQNLMALGMLGNEEAVSILQNCFPNKDWKAFFTQHR